MNIGATIRKNRGDMPLETLGEACGLSASALSMIERDKRNPSTDALARIADALGTTVFKLTFEATWGLSWDDFSARLANAGPRQMTRFLNDPSLAGAST